MSESGGAHAHTRARRHRSVLLAVGSGLGSRLVALLAPLLVIPLMLDHLGTTLFGVWATAVSVTALAAFADLGLGNGLLTRLSACLARGEVEDARRYVGAAYLVLTGAGIGLLLLSGGALLLVSGLAAPGTTLADPVAVQVVGTTLAVFCLSLPLVVVQRLQYAAQRAWAANAWQVAGAFLGVGLTWAAVTAELPVPVAVLASLAGVPLAALVNSVTYFAGAGRAYRPVLTAPGSHFATDLLRLSSRFLLLGVLTSVALNVDNVLVAGLVEVEAVTPFSIATRLFSVLTLVATMVGLALWPASAEALARRDTAWVASTVRFACAASLVLVLAAGAVLLAARSALLELWLDGDVVIPLALGVGLVAWSTLLACAAPFFSVQNSIGSLRLQYAGWAAFLALSVPLKVVLVQAVGSAGIPAAACAAYLCTLLPAAVLGSRAALRSTEAAHSEQRAAHVA
jgi:O-antigen/teichoic acid export membrane protein